MANNVVDINKSWNPYFGSIAFFVLVVLLTLSLYLYNNLLVKENKKLEINISELNISIDDIEKDDSFKIYSLIEINKRTLDGLINRTNITKYINHMQSIMSEYDLLYRWFWISNLNLTTWIIINSDENWYAYKKVVNFISNYKKDEKALFNLGFINRISWHNNMKIDLKFEIK